jgi:hypothetical protein
MTARLNFEPRCAELKAAPISEPAEREAMSVCLDKVAATNSNE